MGMLQRNEWYHQGSWGTPFLFVWFDSEAKSIKNAESYGYKGYAKFLLLNRDQYVSMKDYLDISEYLGSRAKKEGRQFFNEIRDISNANNKKLLSFARKLQDKDFSKYHDDQLKEAFLQFSLLVKPCMAFAPFIRPLDILLVELLREKIQPYADEENVAFESLLVNLTPPLRVASMVKERRDLLRIAVEVTRKKDVKQAVVKRDANALKALGFFPKLEHHALEYGWMNSFDFSGTPSSADFYLERLKNMLKSPDKDLEEIEQQQKSLETKYTATLRDIESHNYEIEELAEVIREFVNVKSDCWESISRAGNSLRPLFTEIAKKKGLTYHEAIYLSPDELFDFSKSNKEESLRRQKIQALIRDGDEVKEISFEDAEKLIKEFSKVPATDEVRGLMAYPGTVTGRVCLVMHSSEIGKVKKGDIIVCPMTDPDYMVAADKFAGIVTDHGGVLCHAAIVSREMKIPCIVRTEYATKIFKDGDIIELDASSGVIKKVK